MTTPSTLPPVEQLRAEFGDQLIGPGDGRYDDARTLFMGGMDRRPAAIVRPRDATDVARVIRVARETGAELAVKSGGHSTAGHSVVDDGIVIDLAEMRRFELDPDSRTVWAQTGLTAHEYTQRAGEHGLATGFGDAGTVGIGGITLGGGVGFLSRAYGLTIDELLAAEIVTAEGEILEIDGENHPDLFWAIRGGGGNFGVATRFKYRLRSVPQVVGGMLFLPATPEVVTGFLAAADAAPDELSTILNVMPAPPMPFIPEDRQGELICMAYMCFAGSADEGERVIQPFRELATPIADMVGPIPYSEMYQPPQEDYHPMASGRNLFVDEVDDGVAAMIIDTLNESDAVMRVTQLRVLGGAISRVPEDATAYPHRREKIMVNVAAFYTSPEDKLVRDAWVADYAKRLAGGNTAAYVNFISEGLDDVLAAAYPGPTLERLREVKRRYDPANLFRHNHNISP
ncbi:MAG TPA: FAD-binding oxidoreductase [Solirubrobacterales bacterium]|nr:FAD-binding oxidoreductase [Solirubrobacterales bacterium]